MRISTGVQGLNQILRGGFLPGRVYLVHGMPGTGKSTLGLHFLAAEFGAGRMLITFSSPEKRLRDDARELGLDVDGVRFIDMSPAPETFSQMQSYDIFSPSEIERDPLISEISKAIQEGGAQRIFVDGFEYFHQLAADPFQYRRLVQSFFRFATQNSATVVVASDETGSAADADGVIELEFGDGARMIRITKFRGSDFQAGRHAMRLTSSGCQVLPNAA